MLLHRKCKMKLKMLYYNPRVTPLLRIKVRRISFHVFLVLSKHRFKLTRCGTEVIFGVPTAVGVENVD